MKTDKRGRYLREKSAKQVAVRIERVKESLSTLKKVRNESLTLLSERLSQHMKNNYPDENVSATTLRREDSYYREYLLKFLGGASKDTPATTQQELMMEKVKVRELTKINNKLKEEISKLLEENSTNLSLDRIDRTHGLEDEKSEAPYRALVKCLNAIGSDSVEISEAGIYDLAHYRGKKLILAENEFPDFFRWYFKSHPK